MRVCTVSVAKEWPSRAVWVAAQKGDHATVAQLAESGARLDNADEHGRTPLYMAVQGRHYKTVRMLLGQGADPRLARRDDNTLAHIAACVGDLEMLRILHKAKAPLHAAHLGDAYSATPVRMAVLNGHMDVVRWLAYRGADVVELANDEVFMEHCEHYEMLWLQAVERAGSWRKYIALHRMVYVRIRHDVGRDNTVLEEDHKDRALLHFMFGGRDEPVGDADAAAAAAAGPLAKRAPAETVLRAAPGDIFGKIVGYLV